MQVWNSMYYYCCLVGNIPQRLIVEGLGLQLAAVLGSGGNFTRWGPVAKGE
jgi:hypothetical protein